MIKSNTVKYIAPSSYCKHNFTLLALYTDPEKRHDVHGNNLTINTQTQKISYIKEGTQKMLKPM